MNAIYNLGKRSLPKFNQVVLLDVSGQVIKSCNTIFQVEQMSSAQVSEWSYLLESIVPLLANLKPGDTEITFSKIHSPFEKLPGFYDFTFTKNILDGEERIVWLIYDYTNLYNDFLNYQQRKNEIDVQRQIFEHRNQSLTNEDELWSNKERFKSEIHESSFSNSYSLLMHQIIANDNNPVEYLFGKMKYSGLMTHINSLNKNIEDFEIEFKEFLGSNNEFLISEFQLSEVLSQIEEKLGRNLSQTKIDKSVQVNLKGAKSVLSQIVYSTLLNNKIHNEAKDPELHFDLEYHGGQCYIKATIFEDIMKNEDPLNNPEDIILRMGFIKMLLHQHKGYIFARYIQEPDKLGIFLKLPIETSV